MAKPGMRRALTARELSEGTLRFLMLAAALLAAEPPELLVLNEPETHLHSDLLPALASLIYKASECHGLPHTAFDDETAGDEREYGSQQRHQPPAARRSCRRLPFVASLRFVAA